MRERWRLRAIVVVWFAAVYLAARRLAPWGDELHFLETVRIFAGGLSVELLRTYSELAGPLTFAAYAAWGHVVGLDTAHLRLLSTILAIATIWLVDDWLRDEWLRDADVPPRMRIGALAVIALNPYFVGLSAFVFTDMLALFFMAAALRAAQRSWTVAMAAALAALLLTRQFGVFLIVGAAAAVIIERCSHWRRRLFAVAAACAPLAALVWLWHGLAPVNERRDIYLAGGVTWDPSALSVSMGAAGVYLFPLVVVRYWRSLRGRVTRALAPRRPLTEADAPAATAAWLSPVGAGLAAAAWTVTFPVRATAIQFTECCETVGYAHKAATMAAAALHFSGGLLTAALFAAGAFLFAASLTHAAQRTSRANVLPLAASIAFLAIAPITHIRWEKYALPLIIVAALAIARRNGRS